MKLNLVAPINQTSYGLTSLNVLRELTKLGHEVALFPLPSKQHIDCPEYFIEYVKEGLGRARLFDTNAPSLRIYHQFEQDMFPGSGLKVAMPIFELTKFTEQEKHQLSWVDRIIVCSKWAREIVAQNIRDQEGKIDVAPLGVDTDIFHPSLRNKNEVSTTRFLTIGKIEIRKSFYEIVDAFNLAFNEDDDVSLTISWHNMFMSEAEHEQWALPILSSKLGHKINIISKRLPSQKDIANLMDNADCGVYLSKAEGFNLECAESLAMGLDVIATNYSGQTEYCNYKNACLIEIDGLTTAFDGRWFHGQGKWAKIGDAQIKQTADYMFDIHNEKKHGRLCLNQQGISTIRENFTWKHTAEKIVKALS